MFPNNSKIETHIKVSPPILRTHLRALFRFEFVDLQLLTYNCCTILTPHTNQRFSHADLLLPSTYHHTFALPPEHYCTPYLFNLDKSRSDAIPHCNLLMTGWLYHGCFWRSESSSSINNIALHCNAQVSKYERFISTAAVSRDNGSHLFSSSEDFSLQWVKSP